MDLINDKVGTLYRKYLISAFGSSLVSSIYGVVDTAMVGQYHGPEGAAAMAVIGPVWNIIYSLGLLSGIGGSVLYSVQRGRGDDRRPANRFLTSSVLLTLILAALCFSLLHFAQAPLLRFFGADESILPIAQSYMTYIQFFVPSFMFTSVISAFLRNDSDPGRATVAVIIGGIVNVVGDYICIFLLDMGAKGASLATAIGSFVSLFVMMTHFLSKKNTLVFERPLNILKLWRKTLTTGFPVFFVDIAMGILTVMFNRQIMSYLNTDALAVYGVIVNISTFVQCCAYGVGQASQPIFSQNFGAGKYNRIKTLLKYNIITILIIAAIWLAAMLAFPNGFIKLFMTPTKSVLEVAPFIVRCYATSFVFLLLNVYSTYYFQSVLKRTTAFIVSISRGLVVSGILIMIMPVIFGADSLWLAMTVAEFVVTVYAMIQIGKSVRAFNA